MVFFEGKCMARFNIESDDYNEWVEHFIATYIPYLKECTLPGNTNATDIVQVTDAVNKYRGMVRSGSREDKETYRFLTKICNWDHTQVHPARH